ncbi:ARL15 [Cordylochernes scorpioides]|uniref:ARL15 n=1 Tax=Cordylochernes scorpioides TaxID=51811 RepID=A0ABY6KT92_9ARAC|nr:ARL15 [Cordylochernes scorpioides]
MSCHRVAHVARDQYEVLCLGLSGAGKSTLLATLVGEATEGIEPTTGFNIKTLPLKETVLDIKELGGAENVRPFWPMYFAGQHGLVFAVDASAAEADLQTAVEALRTVLAEPGLKGVPCVILGTHQDCQGARTKDQLEQLFHQAVHGHKWMVEVCSLGDRDTVQRALCTLVDFMTMRRV